MRIFRFCVAVCALFTLCACNFTKPEQYFDQAVLNSNMLSGFAAEGLYRELEQPGVKLNEATGKTEPMKRTEIITTKIAWAEQSLQKIKDLPPTEETSEMLQTSVAMFEYVLPVYKTDYMRLAEAFDAGAPQQKLEDMGGTIYDKHFPKFERLYSKLVALGKPYAAKHNIKVKWEM